MNQEQLAYWVEIAEYDVETARAMYATKRWLYVGFMCHQAVEKIMTPEYCSNLLSQTELFVSWIKQQF